VGGGRITSSIGLFVARLLERGGGYSSECSDSVFDKSWSGHVVPSLTAVDNIVPEGEILARR